MITELKRGMLSNHCEYTIEWIEFQYKLKDQPPHLRTLLGVQVYHLEDDVLLLKVYQCLREEEDSRKQKLND